MRYLAPLLASICFSIQPFATFRRVSPGPPDKVVSLAAPRSHSFFVRWSPKVVRNVTRSRRHYFSFAFSPISACLRLAEKSVEQLIWQLSGCLRSETSHTVKPTKNNHGLQVWPARCHSRFRGPRMPSLLIILPFISTSNQGPRAKLRSSYSDILIYPPSPSMPNTNNPLRIDCCRPAGLWTADIKNAPASGAF
jgi:hypothetical protein